MISLVWDPLDKFIGALTATNHILIFNASTLEIFKKIDLSMQDSSSNQTIREDRKIDWSTDCQFLLAPCLDDKLLPMLCAIDR